MRRVSAGWRTGCCCVSLMSRVVYYHHHSVQMESVWKFSRHTWLLLHQIKKTKWKKWKLTHCSLSAGCRTCQNWWKASLSMLHLRGFGGRQSTYCEWKRKTKQGAWSNDKVAKLLPWQRCVDWTEQNKKNYKIKFVNNYYNNLIIMKLAIIPMLWNCVISSTTQLSHF